MAKIEDQVTVTLVYKRVVGSDIWLQIRLTLPFGHGRNEYNTLAGCLFGRTLSASEGEVQNLSAGGFVSLAGRALIKVRSPDSAVSSNRR